MADKLHELKERKAELVAAIKAAELNTSGEIRLHIEEKCKEDVLDRAAGVFDLLNMHRTAQRNGVLFYLATADRQFAILGDVGINTKVPKDFWENIRNTVLEHFKQGQYVEGLCKGIEMSGAQLKAHFPYQQSDKNELSDEISFGK
jgi:uncharacterized membrane protein